MPISIKSQKMLWGRAAGRCSYPGCKLELYEDQTETDDISLVGENCHIIAESDDGPRADPSTSLESRNSYTNLILLCRNHHKIVDDQPGLYTIEALHEMKTKHETWVKEQLGFDENKQRDDEQYAGMVDAWERLAHVNDWLAWSSHMLSSGQPYMSIEIDSDLEQLRGWLLSRVWPGRYLELENAFQNFRLVLGDLQETFRIHADRTDGRDIMRTKKFYKIIEWDEKRYAHLSQMYDFHVDLVEDLMLELSRAANLICDRVRQYLRHSYRIVEGRLVIQYGPTSDFAFHDVVVQYSAEERTRRYPYPGKQAFLIERAQRDMHFGSQGEP